MSKLVIEMDNDSKEKLKKLAKEDYRSLTNYITVLLKDFANGKYILSSAVTLAQLKELGVQDIKIKNAPSPEEEEDTLPELPEQYDNIKTSFTPEELIEERRKVKKRNEDIAHFMNIVYTHTRLSRKHDINYIFDSDSSFVVLWPDTDLFKKCPHSIDYGINEYNVDTKKVRYAYSLPDDVLINEYCPDLNHYIDANGDIKINK